MAENVKVSASVNVGNGLIVGAFSVAADQVGSENIGATQAIATSSTAIALGNVTTVGYVLVINTDAANYVEIDSASTFDKFPQKILAGKGVLLAPQTVTIYGKANTAAVNIRVVAVEL